MSKYLLEENSESRTELWFDDFDDSFKIAEIQDASQIVDDAKRKFNDFGDRLTSGKMGEWHHTHSIPIVLYQKWKEETKVPDGMGGWLYMVDKDPAVLASYLNNPDYSYFRVSPTKI